jgi:hypothetical protein
MPRAVPMTNSRPKQPTMTAMAQPAMASRREIG